ncbi:DUF1573 domain-containing protein [Flavobacterium sp.]|uniref:DUF1573 domain-containing protein n=1 Tax=Flavobacterium sp. TaxID=239 RepID=UPI003BC013AD
MKTVINYKQIFILLTLLTLVSCFKYKEEDREYNELKKLPNEKLTKLELVNYINMDTVNEKIFKTSFKMKNSGNRVMKNVFIKGICSCTTFSDYKKTLLPNEEQTIDVTIDLAEEKGNFLKEIFLYGTFYPYSRKIQIVGFKK